MDRRLGWGIGATMLTVAAALLLAPVPGYSDTQGKERREERRDKRDDARDAKDACKDAGGNRPECRQEKREVKRK